MLTFEQILSFFAKACRWSGEQTSLRNGLSSAHSAIDLNATLHRKVCFCLIVRAWVATNTALAAVMLLLTGRYGYAAITHARYLTVWRETPGKGHLIRLADDFGRWKLIQR